MEAGADMAKPQGVDRAEEIARVLREVPGSHFATLSQAAGAASTTLDELEALGVAAVTMPSLALFAAAQGVTRVIATLKRSNSLAGLKDDLLPLADYYDLVGLPSLLAREESCDLAAQALAGRHSRSSHLEN